MNENKQALKNPHTNVYQGKISMKSLLNIGAIMTFLFADGVSSFIYPSSRSFPVSHVKSSIEWILITGFLCAYAAISFIEINRNKEKKSSGVKKDGFVACKIAALEQKEPANIKREKKSVSIATQTEDIHMQLVKNIHIKADLLENSDKTQEKYEPVHDAVVVNELISVSLPIAPPPPPPPLPMFGSKREKPEFKHCPLSPISCSSDSLFAQITIEDPQELVSEIFGSIESLKEQYGLKPPSLSKSIQLNNHAQPERRDSGYEDEEPKTPKIQIMEDRKSKRIDLLVKQTRLTTFQICKSVDVIDEYAISLEIIQDMLKCLPNEQELLQLLTTSKEQLNPPERFVFELAQVPQYEMKMKIVHFMQVYPSLLKEAENDIKAVIDACEQLEKHEQSYVVLLKYATAVAQVMNKGRLNCVSSEHGNTLGFKLTDLAKLADVKTNQITGKKCQRSPSSILDHLIVAVKKNQDFSLGNVSIISKAAAIVDLSMEPVFTIFQQGTETIEQLLQMELEMKLHIKLQDRLVSLQEKHNAFIINQKNAQENFKQLLKKFNDPDAATPEAFFSGISSIISLIK